MPIPKPSKNETQKDFMIRCVGNPLMVEEYKDRSQRIAICSDSYRRYKKL